MTEIRNAHAGYGKTEILHGVNLEIPAGSVMTVIGHNGCGKSTLLKTMLGMLPLTEGEIILDGISVKNSSPQEIAKKAAYLSQFRQCGDISVERLVLHGRFPYLSYPRKYGKKDHEAARAAMERMGITALAERPLRTLSGGMIQKAYIAMALAQNASVILMDEPNSYLDIGQQFKFMQTVRELAGDGKTIVLVLHDLLMALSYSDAIAVMDDGRITECASPQELLKSGIIEKLFGVSVKFLETENGRQYYYDIQKDESQNKSEEV